MLMFKGFKKCQFSSSSKLKEMQISGQLLLFAKIAALLFSETPIVDNHCICYKLFFLHFCSAVYKSHSFSKDLRSCYCSQLFCILCILCLVFNNLNHFVFFILCINHIIFAKITALVFSEPPLWSSLLYLMHNVHCCSC